MTNGLPREEADAKFEAWRRASRLDLLSSISRSSSLLTLDTAVLGLNSKIDSKFELMLQEIRHVSEIAVEARTAALSIKWNMLFASLGTLGVTMSMLFGLWMVGYQIADLIRPH